MKRLLLSLLIAALFTIIFGIKFSVPVKAATNYYVSYTDGNDNNNGASSSTPWKTLERASSITYQAGDQLLLKCGDTWTENLTLAGSGTAASPITVTSYGAGAKPIIQRNFDSGWSVWQDAGSVTVENIPSSSDKSVKIYDNSTTKKAFMEKTFTAQTGSMWAEARVRAEQTNHGLEFELRSGTTGIGKIRFHSNGYITYADSSGEHNIQTYSSGTYYKFKFVADASTDKFDVYVDDVLKASNCGFITNITSIDRVRQESWGSTAGTMYVDDVKVTTLINDNFNLQQTGFTPVGGACINIISPWGWKFTNLEVSKSSYAGILGVIDNNIYDKSYLWFENLYVHDCYDSDPNFPFPQAILIYVGKNFSDHNRTVLSDVTMKDITVERCVNGVMVYGSDDVPLWGHNVHNVQISGITGIDNESCTVGVAQVEGGFIKDSISVNSGNNNLGPCSGFAIGVKGNFVIDNCEFADTVRPSGAADGCAFDFEGYNDGLTIQNCLFHDSDAAGIFWYNNGDQHGGDGSNINMNIVNNVFYNNAQNPPDDNYRTENYFCGGVNTGTLSNNVIYERAGVPAYNAYPVTSDGTAKSHNTYTTENEANGTNLALSATATVSSGSNSGYVKDGSTGTSWSATSSTDQWIQLDFSSNKSINKFIVKEPGTSHIKRFQVQYWDSANSVWKSCFNGVAVGASRMMPIVPVTTSKVRFYICNTTSGNPSVSEFEVYNVSRNTEEFSSSTLDGAWSWIRQDSANWSLTARPGYMRINTQGQDLWGASNNTENILLCNAPSSTDWTAKTKLEFNPTDNYQNAGLIVYQNDDNYVKISYGYDSGLSGGKCVDYCKEIGGSPANGKVAVNSSPIYLRIKKTGTSYSLDYSTTDESWITIQTYTNVSLSSIRIGLFAQGTAGASADFDWFSSPSAVVDSTFNAETAGNTPGGWTVSEAAGEVRVREVPSATDKSVKLYDNSASNASSMYKSFTAQTGGLITATARVRAEQTGHGLDFDMNSGGASIGYIRFFSNGYLKYTDSAGDHDIQTYSSGTFYKLKIVANITTRKFDVYIDDVLKASNCGFINSVNSIDRMTVQSWGSTSGTFYVDDTLVIPTPY